MPTARSIPGKQVFFDTLRLHGVDLLFGNPGTTENPVIDGLVDHPELRYVLTLHEGVALGAAHYYSQAASKPAVVNLHVAPGLGNALGMLYNAAEAGSPLIVTAGQQDTRMRLREPLLGADLVAMAAPLVKWSVQAERADELGHLLHRAFKVATDPPRGPVFVALPIDVLEQQTVYPARAPGQLHRRVAPAESGVRQAADLLLSARRPVIIVGDGVAGCRAQRPLVALSETLGAAVWYEGLHHHIDFPTDHPNCRERLPFDFAGIRRALGDADLVLLIGGSFFEEIWFDEGSPFPEGARLVQLEDSAERLALNFAVDVGLVGDIATAVEALTRMISEQAADDFRAAVEIRNAELGEERNAERQRQLRRAEERWDSEPVATARLMAELERALPAGAIVVNEAITANPDLRATLRFSEPGSYYGTRGGGIGQALPGALGVQLAHPESKVVAISGDGSAMYSIQALWTAAHCDLPVLFVILHNREYKILKYNMEAYRRRFGVDPDRPFPQMDLTRPELDFVALARGMGVKGCRVDRAEELAPILSQALDLDRPYLLDVWIETRVGESERTSQVGRQRA